MNHPDPAARASAPPGTNHLLAGLTPEQAQAVIHGRGPLLLIAGPGAGKTKTLTHRVAHLLASGQAQPWQILTVTFSVRAAGELRLRLADLLGEERARGVTAATFHSVCARMLREHAAVFGRTEHYTVYDPADLRNVIEWLLSDSQRGAIQSALADHGQPSAAEVLSEISLAKNRLLTPDSYEHAGRHRAAPVIAAVWREADVELQRSNAFSFDDLLVYAVRLLAEHPHRLAFYRQRWRWLLIDEFQDTNEAQGALIALLAGAGGNVCAVADDDQLIYSWRGAEPRNVLGFGRRFPGYDRIVLGRNFRCRAEILHAAVSCVAHNQRRAPKALIAVRGAGGQVRVLGFHSEHHEAHWVAATVADAHWAPEFLPPRSSCSRARVMPPSRCSPRWPAPGFRIGCSAASGCMSAQRSATRSPTWRCWPTPPTRRRFVAPCRPHAAGSGPRPPSGSSRSRASATATT
jgi:DNA helicase-2/ATP-dependent DNA helicase PcrA